MPTPRVGSFTTVDGTLNIMLGHSHPGNSAVDLQLQVLNILDKAPPQLRPATG